MIIFLYGEDEFRSLQKLAEIKTKFLQKNKEGASLSVFDFSEKEYFPESIVTEMSSRGLFSTKKLITIKNILSSKSDFQSEKFGKFLKEAAGDGENDFILIFWEGGGIKKGDKFFKRLQKIGKCQEFRLLEGSKLLDWIEKELREKSGGAVSMSKTAVQRVAVFTGNDLFLLSTEIDKLVNYKNKGEVTAEDVDLLVKARIDTDIFKTVDALARGDKKTAIGLLHNHLESGEDPFYILSMYFYQFRNLVKIKPLTEKNTSQSEIASKLKIHPFVVRKSLEQAGNFSWEKLKSLYQALCEIDFASKTGKTDIELSLDKLVAGV